ncbi:MAG: 16S rRNA (guanine(966)-N(2))-methyltransferase RsmD [Clostridiaceae bacterium]|nr:16S rRNA (guanine(966)-N(2))-methyltransferase RsmD [Clostridiaceae bacterium]
MRIIAGKARGHRLETPSNLKIRPTTDRIKESIFNIIQKHLYDSIVIDLFSGTGNLGIEALSRNSNKAYFVDNSQESIDIIKSNLDKTRLRDQGEVIRGDVRVALNKIASKGVQADIIFMDPPYKKGLVIPTLEGIQSANLLKASGIIVIDHDKTEDLPEEINELIKYRSKGYGNTTVSFYKQKEEV